MHRVGWVCLLLCFLLMCSACAVPFYDVPYDSSGHPTAQTIVERLQCELRDMVQDEQPDGDAKFIRLFLLNGDYDVEVALSLDVTNSGGLAPSVTYTNPITAATSFAFSGGATLSESRDHTFTENIQFSLRAIYQAWHKGNAPFDCPQADTNLAGTLGIKDFASLASLTQGLDTSNAGGKGVFGGTIQFLVTKNFNAVGPTWTLTHFKGPGTLGSLSQVNTDKVTLAFAQGPNVGIPMNLRVASARPFNNRADDFLQQLLLGSISTQLNNLQTIPH
jgi:hypothetical protein